MATFLLDYHRYALPLRTPLRTSQGLWPIREGLLVRLRDADGRTGYGEAAPIPWFGTETADDCEAVLARLGSEPMDEEFEAVPLQAACASSAIRAARASMEMATNPGQKSEPDETRRSDVAGGRTSLEDAESSTPSPVVTRPAALPTAALLPAGRAALSLIDARLEFGFRTFKWKVGVADPADELAMLDDLLSRMPSGAKMRLDANGAWDRRKAERWLERCADRPIDHVEQPIARDARGAEDLLLGLANDYPTPLALDESLVGQNDVERWIGAGWPGVFVIKPALLSNPAHTMKALAAAHAKVVFSSALETGVGARAALEWAFGWTGAPRALGFGVWPLFEDERFDGPFAAPFLRWSDVERIDSEAIWNALE